jgi:rhodanese-related sulfurtransferase
LFIGDVGRPDLAQELVSDLTQEKLAGYLYDSLRNKIMPLSDDLIVYPNHGAGSACGKNMSKETTDTLGNQKKVNYALRADMTKEEFIEEVLDGLSDPPGYFPQNVMLNIKGYESFDKVMTKSQNPLSPKAFEAAANETEAIVLDVRHQSDFIKGHIPRSVFIGIDGGFAPWVGALIVDVSQPILLVAPQGREEEVIMRLSRVGFDNVIGFLDGSFEAWEKADLDFDTIASISADEFAKLYPANKEVVFDVRKDGEFTAEHVDGAKNTALDTLNSHLSEFPEEQTFYVHCAGGYRSVIAASILKSRGIHNLVDVAGGYEAIKKTAVPRTDYVCPSTLK